MTSLIAPPQQAAAYSPLTGQYRKADGKFASRVEVLQMVDREAQRQRVRMSGHARLMSQGKIDLAEFQTRVANDLKLSHLRMATIASGGKDGLTPRHYGVAGAELKRQYRYLMSFGQDLADGKLTEKQAIARAAQYGESSRTAFFKAELVTREAEQWDQAKRLLDSQAQHCNSCLGHQRLDWVRLSEIVPPTTNCECHSRCRCRIIYRRFVG